MEKHHDLFHNLAMISNEKTKILINIPNPGYIEYDRENNPEILQIIDQPLPIDFMVQNMEANGLTLTCFKTYSIWVENDYQFFVLAKKRKSAAVTMSSKRNILEKAGKRLERMYLNLRYNYH
jgi:trans-aconitate 2-methyltransferase